MFLSEVTLLKLYVISISFPQKIHYFKIYSNIKVLLQIYCLPAVYVCVVYVLYVCVCVVYFHMMLILAYHSFYT